MNFLRQNITTLLLIAIVGILVWNIRGCFTKVQKPEQMIRDQVEREHLEKDRLKDSVRHVIELAAKDSVIETIKDQLAATNPKLQQSKNDTKKIPVIINALSNNELLQRANGFVPK